MTLTRFRNWGVRAGGLFALVAAVSAAGTPSARAQEERGDRPNIVFIMADDLGYSEIGCYGQKKIRTPNIDRLAGQGMRFTQFYSGSPVCAPSRCTLMTGMHTGHAPIRSNSEVQPEGQRPMPADTVTVAELLKERGYWTGATGKWGLGYPDSEGDPNKQGFDLFFGYNCQRHAHNFYPSYLRRNDKIVPLAGNNNGVTGKQYSHDLVEQTALQYIRDNKHRPFFLYVPFTIPHVAIQVPEDSLAEYKGKWDDPPYTGGKGYLPHPTPRAAYAAMVTRMDRSVGRIMDLLKELELEENTLLVFTSDNGPTHGGVGGSDSEFFESTPFRGLKGSVYEGGIRVPFIARWTGKIRAGTTNDLPAAHWDVLPTLCEVTGARSPRTVDGVSILPALTGRGEQRRHPFFYWEFPSYGGQQAVRMGDWKAVRQDLMKNPAAPIELYDLSADPKESRNLAGSNPVVVDIARQIMREQHRPSTLFPFKALDAAE